MNGEPSDRDPTEAPLADDWLLARRYGYGAAGLPIPTPNLRRRVEPRSLREGIGHWRREGAPARTARDLARGLSPPLLAALGMWMLLAVVDRPDESAIAIVAFEAPPVLAQLEPQIPEPIPDEPPPPEPEPSPVEVAVEAPVTPKRPAPPAPKPPTRRPPPQIDRALARIEAPPAPTPARQAAPTPSAPRPTLPPPVAIDGLEASDPAQPARSERSRPRLEIARASRPAPELSPAALPASPAPDAFDTPSRPRRAQPLQNRRSAPPPSPAGLDPVPAAPTTPGSRAPQRARRSPSATPPRRGRKRPDVAVAANVTPRSSAPPKPAPAPRSARATPRGAAPARSGEPAARIPGISLGSLPPCLHEARERSLVQEVVARAGKRASCRGPAGRFHFVETKNVNAFLMGIEAAPGRPSGDRCQELALALDCLADASRRSGR